MLFQHRTMIFTASQNIFTQLPYSSSVGTGFKRRTDAKDILVTNTDQKCGSKLRREWLEFKTLYQSKSIYQNTFFDDSLELFRNIEGASFLPPSISESLERR